MSTEKKNSDLSTLSQHLFDQLDRLNNPDATPEQIRAEVQRAKAVAAIGSQVIASAQTTIEAMRLVANSDANISNLPKMIGAND